MYRNKKFNRNVRVASTESVAKKRPLNTIDENTTFKRKSIEDERHSIFDVEVEFAGQQGSEENIPASQEPSQRYLSQRSQIASTLGRTQSWNSTSRPPSTYLELTLVKAGVSLYEGDSFVLSCDHISFVVKFRDILKSSHNYPENIDTFKTGLRSALEPNSVLALKFLSGCIINSAGEEHIYQSQDSMIVNFLSIDFLCDHVLEVLLEKIEKAATDSGGSSKQQQIPLLQLMLAQLRYVVPSHGESIYKRINSIYERASKTRKRDIIANAEFVLEPAKHDDFTQMLLDNMETSDDFFNKTTINAITNLSLSAQMHGKLRCKILSYVESNQCPNNLLPLLVKFILKVLNEDKDLYIREVVNTLRGILLHYSYENVNTNLEKQDIIDLFSFIEQGLTRSKKFYIFWQRAIAALPENTFKSVDFIIILMLIHIKEDNSLFIENIVNRFIDNMMKDSVWLIYHTDCKQELKVDDILRKRIKNENFSLEILISAKSKFSAVLEKYTGILMHILHDFLKEKHVEVANFARSSYGVLFEICESVQKSILKKLLELTLNKSTQNMTNIALELLKNLHQKHPREIQNWGMLLMPLLDRLNEMTLSQTRTIMGLLCAIAYPASSDECPLLQDQIDMLVKKQMINRSSVVKKQGIIGSAQLINCIARVDEVCTETEEINISINTVSEIPEGRGKIAAKLFERVQSATMYCSESLALFYDELASVCVGATSNNDDSNHCFLNKQFLLWLSETMALYFQTCFTTEDSPTAISGIPLAALKCINTLDDTNSELSPNSALSLAIRISDLVLKPSNEASSSIYALAPTFNLLRVLYLQRSEGSLESINALLGCAIILPKFFDDDDFAERFRMDYDTETKTKILDIYFHCVNWMRETISSFITQRDESTKQKVLQRLCDLIQVEGKIRKLLQLASSDYVPPKCQFISAYTAAPKKTVSGKQAKGRGRPKSKETKETENPPESEMTLLNETVTNNSTRMHHVTKFGGLQRSSSSAKINFGNMYGPKEIYRQMESSIMLILTEKFDVKFLLPIEEVGSSIGLAELQFVLYDLVSKLESITGVRKLLSEENLQYISKPHYFINDLSTFLKNIKENMKKISKVINEQLNKINKVYSHMDLFSEEFCYLRSCFDLSIRLIAAYFSWPDFSDISRTELLKQSLLNLIEPVKATALREKTLKEIIPEAFNDLIQYESSILDLKTAVHFHDFLIILRKLSASNGAKRDIINKQNQEIRSLCQLFLQRKWYNYDSHAEKGARCNVCLNELVKGFLRDCDFKRQLNILNFIEVEVKTLNGKDSALKSFPNFKKTNFPILYRGLCDILVASVNDVLTVQRGIYAGDKLRPWEKSCELLNTLLDILRDVDLPQNFQSFLKYSHMYLKLVLAYALPDMEDCLRRNSERVLTFLKSLQVSTRFLHSLCCQSKAQKNTAIVSQIPFLRQTMETLVFRVKALLAANKCASVFTLGNLRNKDIHGDELPSQTISSSCSTEDSEEEIPEDDATVCDSLLEPNEMATTVYANVVETTGRASKTSSRSNCF